MHMQTNKLPLHALQDNTGKAKKKREKKNQIAVRACFFTRFLIINNVRSTCRETRLSPEQTHSLLQITSVPKIAVVVLVVVVVASME